MIFFITYERIMRAAIFCFTVLVLAGCGHHYTTHRSPLRKPARHMPTLVVSNDTELHSYARTSAYYKKHPIFTVFDKQFFMDHHLPDTGITDTEGLSMLSRAEANQILNDIMQALADHKTLLPHGTVIRDTNFNYTTLCGVIMLKLHHYPLIVKIFRETPHSFVLPFSKGFEPATSFLMSGGSNRHIAGLTRIPNRELLLSLIALHPEWHEIVYIPRKWYWTPDPIEWLYIDGYHLDPKKSHLHTTIPATYAVIADYITVDGNVALIDFEAQKDLIMKLATICSLHLDPNMKNFIIHTKPGSDALRIAIVDTEDHACMTGLTEPITYTTHMEWYLALTGKFLKNTLFT